MGLPLDVGLKNIHGPRFNQVSETVAGELMLTSRDQNFGHGIFDFSLGLDLVRSHEFPHL